MKAVLCGYYGMGNGGDEALLCTLLEMLPSEVTPIVLSGNPDDTRATYGVTAYHRKNLAHVVAALRQADAFIWGGGSLMQDTTSLLNPFYYGGLMILAQGLGLKTIAWGQGIGPLRRSPTRWLTRHCLQHCTAISVRDEQSFNLVQNWGLDATLAPDPVWAMTSSGMNSNAISNAIPSTARSTAINSNAINSNATNPNAPAPQVAVILRPHPLLTDRRLQNLTQALVQFQQTTQTHILLVPFQPVNDRAIATAIQSRLPGASTIVERTNPKDLHGLFSSVTFTIAMRLHGAIMAVAAGCSCWGISYDPKVTQLMNTLKLPGWELEHLPEDATQISQAWIDQYCKGQPLDSGQIQCLSDRAHLHQTLLNSALSVHSSMPMK